MAIYGVGATYNNNDVSDEFITNNIVGTGCDIKDAPELHEYFKSLKVGDIVYIKKANANSDITVKAIGIIVDNIILNHDINNLIQIGRKVLWYNINEFIIAKPNEKNNVRMNTIYEEFHPEVCWKIINGIQTKPEKTLVTIEENIPDEDKIEFIKQSAPKIIRITVEKSTIPGETNIKTKDRENCLSIIESVRKSTNFEISTGNENSTVIVLWL